MSIAGTVSDGAGPPFANLGIEPPKNLLKVKYLLISAIVELGFFSTPYALLNIDFLLLAPSCLFASADNNESGISLPYISFILLICLSTLGKSKAVPPPPTFEPVNAPVIPSSI